MIYNIMDLNITIIFMYFDYTAAQIDIIQTDKRLDLYVDIEQTEKVVKKSKTAKMITVQTIAGAFL